MPSPIPSRPITAILVGAGHRALVYAAYAQQHPDKLRIVGVADPSEARRRHVAALYNLTPDQCFRDADDLARRGKRADANINGTLDAQHVPTSLPLLEAGYDILLEKPFAVSEAEVDTLAAAVQRSGRRVMICHVLRYAPFYVALKRRIQAGEIGTIINIQAAEHVSYHHYSVAFVRGKWRRQESGGSSFLMQKSCHDLDLLAWFLSGNPPRRVASMGGRHFFTREQAPAGAGEQCLVDCPIEATCDYSCRRLYLDHPERWTFYVWAALEHLAQPTAADREALLRDPANPYSRCVWKLDNSVVDRQSIAISFADGATATLNVIGGCSRPMRNIHIIGTRGELHGIMDENRYCVRHIDARPGREYTEQSCDLADEGDTSGVFGGHGGGDERLIADFVALVSGGAPSLSCTVLKDSINGHRMGFAADRALRENRVVELDNNTAQSGT